MEAGTKKLYEGMFLVDSAIATADWDGILSTIRTILERAQAEIVSLRKWDERKLVYDIGGKSRGTYILSYFRAEGPRVRDIERDVQLSEKIMRALILNAEQMTPKDIEKETPATKTGKPAEGGLDKSGKPSGHGTPAVPGESQKAPASSELVESEETISAEETAEELPGTE